MKSVLLVVSIQYFWAEELPDDPNLWQNYLPTENALALNRD